MMPPICHIWYYATLRLVNSEENGNFSGTRGVVYLYAFSVMITPNRTRIQDQVI